MSAVGPRSTPVPLPGRREAWGDGLLPDCGQVDLFPGFALSHGQMNYSAARADALDDVHAAVASAILESRAFLAAVFLQILAASVMCAVAHRPMFVGLVDSYDTFLGAGALIGVMALAVGLFRWRQAIGSRHANLENYRLA